MKDFHRTACFSVIFILSTHYHVIADDTFKVFCEDAQFKIKKHNEISCSAKQNLNYPWTFNDSRTAPKPTSLDLEVVYYKLSKDDEKERHIGLRIKWTQKAMQLNYVKGYHIELNYINPPGSALKYEINFNNNLRKKIEKQRKPYVAFEYQCCGNPSHIQVVPEDFYIIKLQAMPIYLENHDQLSLKQNITIPDCKSSKKISRTVECRKIRHERKERRQLLRSSKVQKPRSATEPRAEDDVFTPRPLLLDQEHSMNKVHIILFVACSFIFLLAVVVVLLLVGKKLNVKCPTKKLEPNEKRSILLVCSTNKRYADLNNLLINAMKKCDGLCVEANLRQTSRIGSVGIADWAEDSIQEADIVIFLPVNKEEFLPGGKDDDSVTGDSCAYSHEMRNVLKVAQNIHMLQKSSGTKCENKFILGVINKSVRTNKLTFCRHYYLPSDLRKFLKHALADCYHQFDKKEVTIIEEMLNTSQLACDQEEREQLPNARNVNENDLDISFHIPADAARGQPISLNIFSDGPSSNSSGASYNTTDMNVLPRTIDRTSYESAGARPKFS